MRGMCCSSFIRSPEGPMNTKITLKAAVVRTAAVVRDVVTGLKRTGFKPNLGGTLAFQSQERFQQLPSTGYARESRIHDATGLMDSDFMRAGRSGGRAVRVRRGAERLAAKRNGRESFGKGRLA